MQKVALEILRDHQDAVDPARKDLALRARDVRQYLRDRDVGSGVDPTGEVAAALRSVAIDDGDRDVAQRLIQIGLGIEQGIERGAQDEHGKGRLDRKDATNFIAKSVQKAAHDGTSASGCGALRASIG